MDRIVIYPNIHFTSTVFNTTVGSRNQLYSTNNGIVDIQIAAFSNNWIAGRSATFGGLNTTLKHVAFASAITPVNSTTGAVARLDNLVASQDYASLAATTGIFIVFGSGEITVGHLWALLKCNTNSITYGVQLTQCPGLASVGALFAWNSNASYPAQPRYCSYFYGISNSYIAPMTVGYIGGVGGYCTVQFSSNIHISEYSYSGMTTGVADTTNLITSLYVTKSEYVTFAKSRKPFRGVAARNYWMWGTLDCNQITVKDVIYDLQSNGLESIKAFGTRFHATNCTFDNPRTTLLDASNARSVIAGSYSKLQKQCVCNVSGFFQQGVFNEWIQGAAGWITTAGSLDGNPFSLAWTNAAGLQVSSELAHSGPMPTRHTEQLFLELMGQTSMTAET